MLFVSLSDRILEIRVHWLCVTRHISLRLILSQSEQTADIVSRKIMLVECNALILVVLVYGKAALIVIS
jgi:hypothetical protein